MSIQKGKQTLVVSHHLWPISLIVLGLGVVGAVDRQLKVVASETVAVCVGVGEQTSLEVKMKIMGPITIYRKGGFGKTFIRSFLWISLAGKEHRKGSRNIHVLLS